MLSPHLDDAVLSLGALLHDRRSRGERVLVVTVFAGDEPASISPLAAQLHRLWGLQSGVVAARRREDSTALEVLGVDGLHWPLREAIYRSAASGEPCYRRVAELFRRPAEEDRVEGLVELLAGLPDAAELLVPLAVGGHVDHRLVRVAAEERWRGAVLYYEELPYATRPLAGLRARGLGGGWRCRRAVADAQSRSAKCEAIAAYRSQLSSLFGDEARMRREVERRVRRRGERVWWRASRKDRGLPLTTARG